MGAIHRPLRSLRNQMLNKKKTASLTPDVTVVQRSVKRKVKDLRLRFKKKIPPNSEREREREGFFGVLKCTVRVKVRK